MKFFYNLGARYILFFCKSSRFQSHMKELVQFWYDDRYSFKVSMSDVNAYPNDFKVKVTDFEILHLSWLKFFRVHVFQTK